MGSRSAWALSVLLFAGCAAEKADGRPRMHRVTVEGVKQVKQKGLRSKIALEATSWIPLSPKHYLDAFEVEADRGRIEAYYASHGYFFAKVTTAEVLPRGDGKSVDVRFVVDEGPPTMIDQLCDRFEARGAFDGRAATARLDAHQAGRDGALAAEAKVPVDPAQPLLATLRAHGLYLDIENAGVTDPRLVKGTLDASLDVSGPRANPTVAGFVRVRDGELGLAAASRIYKSIKLDLRAQDGAVMLSDFEAHVGSGGVRAHGSATLAGLRPKAVDIDAEAHSCMARDPGRG